MAEWHIYTEPLEVLNAEDVNNIQENIIVISNLLKENGYIAYDLTQFIAYKTSDFIDVYNFLQNIENNLWAISQNSVKSIYFGDEKTLGEYAPNKEEVWRWVQILNDMYGILTGEHGKWQYLLCLDGYPVIRGKKILVRGDTIG